MATQRSITAPWKAAAVLLALCAIWQAGPALARPPEAGQGQTQSAALSEQSAATGRQARKTEQANRAAAVEDETSTAAQAARTAQSETAQFEAQARRSGAGSGAAAPSYGPTLAPRSQGARDPARKDPAEVHDETDSLARPAPANPADSQRRTTNPNLRRPAWQPAAEPMAPRPLRSANANASPAAAPAVPVPAQAVPPSPSGPTRSVIAGCQGNSCTDTSGRRYNGIGTGNAGVSSSGRLCTRSGVSVQCF
ncbi:hypothetical protein [Herbaspirillum sp. SJZ107]|uniref:hypothetical protein n=1 Tax=Herbaspirillum sp. SJZ107 TaxID=2572881 RepID=UPI001150F0F8|nr:hypothetical protein [Herbaspirillum sp. SJZ107]TQK10506.1 hypothetical protein FBX97_0423 [Herbaspirillum sp. SJZ107]